MHICFYVYVYICMHEYMNVCRQTSITVSLSVYVCTSHASVSMYVHKYVGS